MLPIVDDDNPIFCNEGCPYFDEGFCSLYNLEVHEENERVSECIEEFGTWGL